MKEQVRQIILKVLLAQGGPLSERVLKDGVRRLLAAATTEGDLTVQLQWCEQAGLIIGTTDELVGTEWMLTTTGKLRAAQLK